MSFWLYPGLSAAPDLEVISDAAGSVGFRAYFKGEWFIGAWAPCQSEQSIAYASHVWGPQWFHQDIWFRSDNEAVVHILSSRTSKIPCIIYLLRKLLSAAARFSFTFNKVADALSRFQMQEFQQLAPEARMYPLPVPIQRVEDLTRPLSKCNAVGPMLLVRGGFSTVVPSWTNLDRMGARALLMN